MHASVQSFFDTALVNSRLLHRKVHGHQKRQLDFREIVAEALCKTRRCTASKLRRASADVVLMLETKRSNFPCSCERSETGWNWSFHELEEETKMPGCHLKSHVHCNKRQLIYCCSIFYIILFFVPILPFVAHLHHLFLFNKYIFFSKNNLYYFILPL